MTSLIRDLKNARFLYKKKSYGERDGLIKSGLKQQLMIAQEKHLMQANTALFERREATKIKLEKNKKVKSP